MGDQDKIAATDREDIESQEAEPTDADNRKLGFGHKAHQPDPNATYTFTPDVLRPLPIRPRLRWR